MRLTPFEFHDARSMSLGIAGYRDHLLFHVPRLPDLPGHTFSLRALFAPRSYVSAESVGPPMALEGCGEGVSCLSLTEKYST